MSANNTNHDYPERSALQLLQSINSGMTDPKILDKIDRQQCIELLITEGYTYHQIAQILKCSDKTVSRDMKEIRAHNEISPNVGFAKQLIGEMFNKAMNHHSYMMRLAREAEATVADKIQAEFAAWKIIKELIEKMQTLGYLPLKPQELISDVYLHQDDAMKSLEELKGELSAIEKAAQDSGSLDDDTKGQIKLIQEKLEQAQIAQEIKDLASKSNNGQEDSKTEEQNE